MVNQMLQVPRGEGCLVIYELVTFFKVEKRKVNVGDAWFRVSLLSLSLSLSVRVHCFSLLIWSDWVFFVFYRGGHGLAKKLLLIIFIFWQISSTFQYALILCAETPFFHFEESLSTDNIWWMLSWVLVAIIILCVR